MINFFESIKIVDGKIYNMQYHLNRMNKALQTFYNEENYFKNLDIAIPENYKIGFFKCRIVYNKEIVSTQFEPYIIRKITKCFFVSDYFINYAHKFTNRIFIENYTKNLEPNEEIIFIKNNSLTDSSFSNICLFDGKNWHTPKQPLLHGTKRQQLINENQIIEKDISIDDVKSYKKICFINALLELGDLELEI